MSSGIKKLTLEFEGIRPLLLHNGQLADPADPYTIASTKIRNEIPRGGTQKADKEAASRPELSKLAWLGGLYFEGRGDAFDHKARTYQTDVDLARPAKFLMQSDNIERCLQLGAQKIKAGKSVVAALFCTESDYVIDVQGGHRTLGACFEDDKFSLRRGVVVQKQRIIRVRPMLPTGWKIIFTVEYDNGVISEETILKSAQMAGSLIGLGDWRPKFGRFKVNKAE